SSTEICVSSPLSFAKTLSFEPRRSNLRNLVQQTAEALRIKAEEKRISLENNIDDNLELNVDDSAFKIVLQNLYSNAIKFTPAGGKVSVFAKDKGAETQISVLDTGVGIPTENLKKLFRSDYAYSLPGTQNEPGTGLGLILCRELVTSFGGKIWAESSEGEGSVFSFTIPKRK
ncbi:MAG TPA: HAMP domain-containing sensor histidine kinase, partial [Ignavibacteriales bacterium]|nr:HAMP domain-containing sensor histidine kinase [Ignavibacteriales bacterium]